MPSTEIHKVLDELTWDEVEALTKKDSAVWSHIRSCTDCRSRADKVNVGRVANLGAAKRKVILSVAQRLADYFLAAREPPN
jgi:DUF1680 family protein